MAADELAVRALDAPVVFASDHRPGVAGGDRADERASGVALPQSHLTGLRTQVNDRAAGGEPDADPSGQRRARDNLRTLVEVLHDPIVGPAHLRQTVGA